MPRDSVTLVLKPADDPIDTVMVGQREDVAKTLLACGRVVRHGRWVQVEIKDTASDKTLQLAPVGKEDTLALAERMLRDPSLHQVKTKTAGRKGRGRKRK